MSSPEFTPDTSDEQRRHELASAFEAAIQYHSELVNLQGFEAESARWKSARNIEFKAEECGDLFALATDQVQPYYQRIQLGHYDPCWDDIVTYPELVGLKNVSSIGEEASNKRNYAIDSFHDLTLKNEETRTYYADPAIQAMHRQHNLLFRNLGLAETLTVGWNNVPDSPNRLKFEIDEYTLVKFQLEAGTEYRANRMIRKPDQELKINLIGTYTDVNGDKRRHPPQIFNIGKRDNNKPGLFFERKGAGKFFDDKEWEQLVFMSTDLLVLRERIAGFSACTGGIQVRRTDPPPEAICPMDKLNN
jgi:hypothetical protein